MTPRLSWLAWPAFLAACVLELLVFAVVDPLELHWSGQALGWSRQAAHTLAFFVFWLVTSGACALTGMLCRPPAQVNQPPFDAADATAGRPEQGA